MCRKPIFAIAIFTLLFCAGCALNSRTVQMQEETICKDLGRFIFKGDLNGDKKDDLIVGMPTANFNRGEIHIFYGDIDENTSLSFADATIHGENKGDSVGEFIITCDLDGDSTDDLVIGVPAANSNRGEVYIFYSLNGVRSSILEADAVIEGEESGNGLGRFLWMADLNGDAKEDLIIGVPAANHNRGKIFIFYGRDMWGRTSLSFADVTIEGKNEGDRLGEFLLTGDFDKDGKGDLAVGIPTANSKGGEIYLFYGGELRDTSISFENPAIQR